MPVLSQAFPRTQGGHHPDRSIPAKRPEKSINSIATPLLEIKRG
uniref:Uncharacterized protein n=1 Tax=Arundo donax TaxID=35708 RepID=A0A0A9EF68_ARUDO